MTDALKIDIEQVIENYVATDNCTIAYSLYNAFTWKEWEIELDSLVSYSVSEVFL